MQMAITKIARNVFMIDLSFKLLNMINSEGDKKWKLLQSLTSMMNLICYH